ncbi:hypothetical protein OD91_0366 [Lutibacter sp. Hel_I_33_5]|uniref:DUF6438 domain-containing protein n=1 Tax=Lutibacter sp. Hel_I_33_5 TaxID=1566289 RepID=UPI0011A84530|nr:DUF6438 domain-containing protein [Lutibacter sp. Hel_I_33_5]TVZ55124.1 hypothetical protein OD91_0366 [Lutibacter sp. Hel_I_33_5]
MKLILSICLLLLVACAENQKKEKKQTTTPTIKTEVKVEETPSAIDSLEIIEKEVIEEVEVIEEINYNLVSIKKEACDGDCPEFEVTISKLDSILNFNGIKNVALEGEHQLKLTSEQYSEIIKRLDSIRTVTLSKSYLDTSKTFLSTTTLTIEKDTVTVNLWKDTPEQLTNMYIYIEDLLYDQKYLEE